MKPLPPSGDRIGEPTGEPSIANCTLAIPRASDARAVAGSEPVKKLFAAGATMDVDGAVLSTVTVVEALALLPRASTIEPDTTCEPSATFVVSHDAETAPPPTLEASAVPSTANCTVAGFAALVTEPVTGVTPRTSEDGAGADNEIVGYAGPTSTVTGADVCVTPPGNATDQSIAVTVSECVPTATPAVFQAI